MNGNEDVRARRAQPDLGATAVEYALLIGLVSLLVIAGPVGLGVNFQEYASDLVDAVAALLS